MTRDEVRATALKLLAQELRNDVASIDSAMPFADMGLSSESAVKLSGMLAGELGRELSPSIIYDHPTLDSLVDGLTCAIETESAGRASPADGADEPIAIIGIGCKFPGAGTGPGNFLRFLVAGGDGVVEVPDRRWDVGATYHARRNEHGKTCTKWAGLIEDIDLFDAELFGITPFEAARMDPQQRLLLQAAWHAIEDAGYAVRSLAGSRTGVFVGISANEYARRRGHDPLELDGVMPAASALSIAANRISYFLDIRGPSLAIDTACSSSLSAVHAACQALRAGDTDLALAGGVNAVLEPDVSIAFSQFGLMSPDGRCKSFDASADGYVRGEGVGLVVLKKLSTARLDGDKIYAVILGSAIGQDGRSNGLMAPRGSAQESVIERACLSAGVAPRDIDYVEAHGTGTAVGDVLEANALGKVFGRERDGRPPLVIGSVKSNIGHLEAAAGIAGLIKTVLCLRHRVLVPHLHFTTPNPAIHFERLGLRVSTELMSWPLGKRSLAGVSSFGFGGTNVHLVLGEADEGANRIADDSSDAFLLGLSAAGPQQLDELALSVAQQLDEEASVQSQIALINGLARRQAHRHRLAVWGESPAEIAIAVRAFADKKPTRAISALAAGTPKIGYVFTGQGAIWPRAGYDLFHSNGIFRETMMRCDKALRPHLGESILSSLFGPQASVELERTERAQPALFAIQMSLVAVLSEWGMAPLSCVGHSVGEIAAACVAGRLTFDEAAHLVCVRGAAMSTTRGAGRMVSIQAPQERVTELIEPWRDRLEIAAHNGPASFVVGGDQAAIAGMMDAAQSRSINCVVLPVDYPFHTKEMAMAAAAVVRACPNLGEPSQESCRFYSTVEGVRHDRPLNNEYWGRNVREPVRFSHAIAAMSADGVQAFVEIGPHPSLSRDIESSVQTHAVPTLLRHHSGNESLMAAAGKLFTVGALQNLRPVLASHHVLEAPPYPMAAMRHWTEASSTVSKAFVANRATQRRLAFDDTMSLQEASIDTRESSYLRDHRIFGEIVFPATGYMDLFLSAARDYFDERNHVLENFSIESPLILSDDTPVSVQLTLKDEDQGASMRLYALSDGAWHLHATALARVSDAFKQQTVDVGRIKARCFDVFPHGLFYEQLDRRGLAYGDSFKGVQEVFARRGEALARIDITSVPPRSAHTVHPAVFDACLHGIAAAVGVKELLDVDNRRLLLPQMVEQISLHTADFRPAWSHCLITENGEQSVTADVVIADDQERVLLELKGLSLRGPRRDFARRRALANALSHWQYVQTWTKRPIELVSTERLAEGGLFLLCDDAGHGDALAAVLTQSGRRCVRIYKGKEYARNGEDSFQVNPASVDDFSRLIHCFPSSFCAAIVHLWSLDSTFNETSHAAATEAGPRSLAALVQTVETSGMAGRPRLTIVTQAADTVVPGDLANPFQATTSGLARVVAIEHANLRCRRIDLDPGQLPHDGAVQLMTEILESDEENQIAYRNGHRYVARLHSKEVESGPAPAPLSGTYLVTGGWGALGLTAASALIEAGAREIVLAGRSAPGPEATNTIVKWRERGTVVTVEHCDFSNAEEVDALFARLRSAALPMKGIIHAAGALADAAIMNLSAERFDAVFAPKVAGTINLDRAARNLPLDFLVLYSSAASVLGAPGQGNYCSANAFLDAMAQRRCAEGLPTVSIGWGAWSGSGMAHNTDKLASSTLVEMISHEVGGDLLISLLSARGHLAILPFSIQSLVQFYPSTGGLTLFSDLMGARLAELRSDGASETVSQRPALATPYAEAETPVQEILLGMWQRALRMNGIGIKDELFELGGDSVLASQILAEVNNVYGIRLNAESVFDSFTISHVSALIEEELLQLVMQMDEADLEAFG